MLLGLIVFGFISIIVGMWLLVKVIRSRKKLTAINTYVNGAVGVILITLGFVLLFMGMVFTISL